MRSPMLPPASDRITLSNDQRTRNLPLKQSAVTDFSEDKCFYAAPGQILLDANIKIPSAKRSIIINLLNLIILLEEFKKISSLRTGITTKVWY